jgi:hypothetical protein
LSSWRSARCAIRDERLLRSREIDATRTDTLAEFVLDTVLTRGFGLEFATHA